MANDRIYQSLAAANFFFSKKGEIAMKNWLRTCLDSRLFLFTVLIALSLLSIMIGSKDFSLQQALAMKGEDFQLLLISRLPRLVSILVTGASLSLAGLVMQTISSNKFVSPSTAGTMEWCKFGVMLSILFFGQQSSLIKMSVAFITALLGTILFMQIIQRMKIKNAMVVPLMGMMLGNLVGAITSFVAYRYDIIQNMSSWLQGSFSLIIKGRYELLYIGIPFFILAYAYANKFTIAGMGESMANNLGVNYKLVTTVGLMIVAFITSSVVVTVGSIPFVGLIIPNMVAMYRGDNVKRILFDAAMAGAIFVLICDIIGRLIIFPYEISISVVISIIGSVIFLTMLYRRKTYAQ